jgi:hypothetical protein
MVRLSLVSMYCLRALALPGRGFVKPMAKPASAGAGAGSSTPAPASSSATPSTSVGSGFKTPIASGGNPLMRRKFPSLHSGVKKPVA